MTQKVKNGFTLVELVIVIAVIAILAAVLLPTFAGILNRARDNERLQMVTNARKELYTGNENLFTTTDEMEGYIFILDDEYVYQIVNGEIVNITSTKSATAVKGDFHYTKLENIVMSNQDNIEVYKPAQLGEREIRLHDVSGEVVSTITQEYVVSESYGTDSTVSPVTISAPDSVETWGTGYYTDGENYETNLLYEYDSTSEIQFTYNLPNDVDLYATYSRVLNFISGVNSSSSQVTQYYVNGSATDITIPNATPIDNWEAVGYAIDTVASSTVLFSYVTFGASTSYQANNTTTTFNAVYSRELSIVYDANNGTGTQQSDTATVFMNTNTIRTFSDVSVALPSGGNVAVSKTGSTFGGWAEASNGTTAVTTYTTVDVDYNANQYTKTFYAIWQLPPYITFSSPSSFRIKVDDNSSKHWDGTMEYSTDANTWTIWNGLTTIYSSNSGDVKYLHLRGTGNTIITGERKNNPPNTAYRWILTGSDISVSGNIENLLDYATVSAGGHPQMKQYCFTNLFYGSTSLISAQNLEINAASNESCYYRTFAECTSLTTAPATLPATTLVKNCYGGMFDGCTSLTTAPKLPATTLAERCYSFMFEDCTNLIIAPELSATTLVKECYYSMFTRCRNLLIAPELPATTLAQGCYNFMFMECDNLITLPALPATTLADSCYYAMFHYCKNIKLSTTQTDDYPTAYCVPASGTGTTADNALNSMFTGTGGTFKSTPTINTTYYLYTTNTIVETYNNKQTVAGDYIITTVAANGTLGDYTVNGNTITITLAESTDYILPTTITCTGATASISGGTITISNITGNVQIVAVCTKQS